MRADRLSTLILLLLTVALAGACSSDKSLANASPDNAPQAGAGGAAAPANRGVVRTNVYRDPDGAFTLNVPEGWRVEREEKNGAYMTAIRPDGNRPANLSILTVKAASGKDAPAELRSFMLDEGSKPFFSGWVEGLKEQARVEDEVGPVPTRLGRSDALRKDLTYYRGDADDPRRGRGIYLIGDDTTFFISLTASRPLFGELEEIIATLRIEP